MGDRIETVIAAADAAEAMTDPAIEAAQRAWAARYPRSVNFEYSLERDGLAAALAGAAREALKLIRELHKPLTIKCIESMCAMGECDHDDDTCPENIPVKVCAKCWDIADSINSYHSEEGIVDELIWPCATAKLAYATEELA